MFLTALQQRKSAEFPDRLAQLLQQREQLWTPEYKSAFHQTETATRQLLIGLIADSTPAQRQQIQQKLQELRQDFKELKCMQAANPG